MFKLIQKDGKSNGRFGEMPLSKGKVETPVFMPVGTYGAVKTLAPAELKEIGTEIILGNTYHLYLKPGADLIAKAGGLSEFSSWKGPVLTDSGGFQVFSLGQNVKIEESGVHFRSPTDGSSHFFTPETAMEVQAKLGSDIAMVLDQPSAFPATEAEAGEALRITAQWAKASKKAAKESQQVFGIVQGSVYPGLRKRSIVEITEIDFDGYAFGGFSVGEPLEKMYEMVEELTPLLPQDKPRYLMGIGDPVSLVKCISYGIDLFDSVLPTRMARNGSIFTSEGRLNIRNKKYYDDFLPLDSDCACYACENFSRAYIRHIYMSGEILAHRLLTLHNLFYTISLVKKAREALKKGKIKEMEKNIEGVYRCKH